MSDYGPILWVVSMLLLLFLAIKAVQLTRGGKRVSWKQEAHDLSSRVLRAVDCGQRRKARMLLRRLEFIVKRKGVDEIDLDLLATLVNNVRASQPCSVDMPKGSKEPILPEAETELNESGETRLADEQMLRDLRLLRERLFKAKHLTLELRTELLDIESVITRNLKRFDN